MRACASCGRNLGKVATRCLYCGTIASDAPPAAAGARPLVTTCPGCLRNVRVAHGASGSCSFCALAFHVDDDGTARVGRTGATPAATRAQVDKLVADLPSARLWDVVRDVLHRRAAFNELGADEPVEIIAALTLIATWPGTSPTWLPIPIADAVGIIPRAIFGVADGGLLPEEGETVLLSTIATAPRHKDRAHRAAAGLLGHGVAAGLSALTSNLGFGLGYKPPEDVDTRSRIQLRAHLTEHLGGIQLDVYDQIDQQTPTRLSVAHEHELHRRITASRSTLASYYILRALFGPSCKAATAFSITRDALTARLTALGCDQSPELVEQLCIRMPPTFGT
ncbi:MAG TPA: hypothetical protein VM261_16975 [Kofleriaceae bacterium]|nr:hypothetical protein [Kofleriaceae bacterium]